jgi:hypothetical protein
MLHAVCPCLHFAGQDRQGRQDYQDRTARKRTARINNQKKDSQKKDGQKRQAMIARTGQTEQAGKVGQAEQEWQSVTGRT